MTTTKINVSSLMSGVFTTTGNGPTVQGVPTGNSVAYLNATVVSGTTPSLTVTLMDSPDGVTWYAIPSGAFAAVTATGQQRLVLPAGLGPFVRASYAISGTTPSFTVTVTVAGAE